MKALSIRQPWAWLIVQGLKDIENRDWNDRYPGLHDARRLVEDEIQNGGGRFVIHASKGMTKDEYEDAVDTCRMVARTKPFPEGTILPAFNALLRGGIVGEARLQDVVTEHDSPWFFGRIGLVVKDARPLPFHPMNGALGFFYVPESTLVTAAVRALGKDAPA